MQRARKKRALRRAAGGGALVPADAGPAGHFRDACQRGDAEAATALAAQVPAGAALVAALRQAAAAGLVAVVEALLARPGVDVNAAGQCGRTALWFASRWGRKAAVTALLRGGAGVDGGDRDGRTPLHAASRNGHEAVVTALLQGGAGVDGGDRDGRTPLHAASQGGHEAAVSALLQGGASVDLADGEGWTPLRLAVFKGFLRAAWVLRAAGADPARARLASLPRAVVKRYEAHCRGRERFAFLVAMERLRAERRQSPTVAAPVACLTEHLSREVARFV